VVDWSVIGPTIRPTNGVIGSKEYVTVTEISHPILRDGVHGPTGGT
jgi:hypothetical protein